MALFKIDVTRVTGRGTHLFDGTGIKMISGYGVGGLNDEDVGSSFQYTMNLENDQAGVTRIDNNFISTVVAGYINAADQSSFISLSVYPEQNTALATNTELILIQNITLGYDCDSGSILYVKRGTGLQRLIVSETIDDILDVTTEDTIEWDDSVNFYRLQVRDGYLNLDSSITQPPGFLGTQGVHWDVIWSISST